MIGGCLGELWATYRNQSQEIAEIFARTYRFGSVLEGFWGSLGAAKTLHFPMKGVLNQTFGLVGCRQSFEIGFLAGSWRLWAAKRRSAGYGSAARRGPGASPELARSCRCDLTRPKALDGLADRERLRRITASPLLSAVRGSPWKQV